MNFPQPHRSLTVLFRFVFFYLVNMKWLSWYPLARIPENDFLAVYTVVFTLSLILGEILVFYGISTRRIARRTIYAVVTVLAVAHFAADWESDRIREHWIGWEGRGADYLVFVARMAVGAELLGLNRIGQLALRNRTPICP